MRKIKLDLDALQVESFETGAGQRTTRGTVHGAVDTQACPTSQEPGGPCATILNCGEVTGIACIASEGCGPDTFGGC